MIVYFYFLCNTYLRIYWVVNSKFTLFFATKKQSKQCEIQSISQIISIFRYYSSPSFREFLYSSFEKVGAEFWGEELTQYTTPARFVFIILILYK
jgi:hypothetical protein